MVVIYNSLYGNCQSFFFRGVAESTREAPEKKAPSSLPKKGVLQGRRITLRILLYRTKNSG
jgi:hypothetical protein